MYESFIEKNFSSQSQDTIDTANSILDDYSAQGYTLTLRQLYYQFVARDLIPNNERSYKNLGTLITNGRMAGLISWDAIEDRNRSLTSWMVEESAEEVVRTVQNGVVLDRWERQNAYVEVWVEKDALSSVIRRPCARLHTPYMACKGYLSASEAWRAGKRFERAFSEGKRCVLIHLGDHDPSGIDMTRDNRDRISMFSFSSDVEVRRIALNMPQVEAYRPPPNPAKITDSRAADYIARYGSTSWELDALEPRVLDRLIDGTIREYIDPDIWADTEAEEAEINQPLNKLADNWDAVAEFLNNLE